MTAEIEAMAGGAASEFSRGGMRTKIEAAKIATTAGVHMAISDGRVEHPLKRIADGGPCTWFLTPSNPVTARKSGSPARSNPRASCASTRARPGHPRRRSLLPPASPASTAAFPAAMRADPQSGRGEIGVA